MDPVFDWHPLAYTLLGSALVCIALGVVHAAHLVSRDRTRHRGATYVALAIALIGATLLLRQQEPDAWWAWPVLLALPALGLAAGLWVSDARVLMTPAHARRRGPERTVAMSSRAATADASTLPPERFGPFSRLACICCCHAMVDVEDPSETCRLCDWEARGDNDGLSLEEARRNFERWRSIYPPDRLPPWMTHGLSEEEHTGREAIVACFGRMHDARDPHDLEQWYEIARIEESFERRAPRPPDDGMDSPSRPGAEETSREQRYYGP
jgi:hypothetical protein